MTNADERDVRRGGDSRFCVSADGLRLHYRDYRPSTGSVRLPAICLPGLARTSDDFAPFAAALCNSRVTPRRVLTIDYRGRGLSEWDKDWRHYSLEQERADLLLTLAELGIDRCHVIGTSRGGLHILGIAAVQKNLIQSAVFNDIGPVLEPQGLARIKGYVGKPVHPKSLAEAVAILKIGAGVHFDGLSAEEWRLFAETTFGIDERHLGLRYDPHIARTLDSFDLDKPLPDSWELFDKLAGTPVLTIRGANSDLLSEATLTKIDRRWPGSVVMTVPGQGHAPLLADPPTIAQIDRFLADAD